MVFPSWLVQVRCDGVTVWIRRTSQREASALPLVSLSVPDQAAIKELRNDFAWKLPSVSWPGTISAPATRPAGKVQGQPKGALPTYRTRIFEFICDNELSPKEVGEFGKTFEATNELFVRLPWDIRPAPPEGPFYKVRIYAERNDFMTALGVKDQGSARILGLYRRDDHLIHVPLESLRDGKSTTNGTLRHELAHQMMHDLLPVMPWWVAEGTAEYIRIIPWSSSAYACDSVARPPVMKAIAAEADMNRIAFEEMITSPPLEMPEAETARMLQESQQRIVTYLKGVRKRRADQISGKAVPAVAKEVPKPKPENGLLRTFLAGDEGRAVVLKYHAAKMLVYYLQHLEGEGKGTRMYTLIWHLRQWADELSVQRSEFAKKADEFREA